jgi:ATP-dependent DNA ligase
VQAHLPPGAIIDGELIIWDASGGRTSFAALQRRLQVGHRVAQQAAVRPAHLVCFDLLQDAAGRELVNRPLHERRRRLEQLLAWAPPELVLCPQTSDEQQARRWCTEWTTVGVEGLVIKASAGRYLPGRAGTWRKIKRRRTTEMVIGGCTGTLTQPYALLLGGLDRHGRLRYLAQTHPLTATQRRDLAGRLPPVPAAGSAAGHAWPCPLPATWSPRFTQRQPLPYLPVEPVLVAEVELDLATDAAGRPRHLARFVRARAELLPEHLPPWPPRRR